MLNQQASTYFPAPLKKKIHSNTGTSFPPIPAAIDDDDDKFLTKHLQAEAPVSDVQQNIFFLQ
jgi:hypothetical protein